MTKLFSKNLARSTDLLFLKSLVGSNHCIQHEKALLVNIKGTIKLMLLSKDRRPYSSYPKKYILITFTIDRGPKGRGTKYIFFSSHFFSILSFLSLETLTRGQHWNVFSVLFPIVFSLGPSGLGPATLKNDFRVIRFFRKMTNLPTCRSRTTPSDLLNKPKPFVSNVFIWTRLKNSTPSYPVNGCMWVIVVDLNTKLYTMGQTGKKIHKKSK